LRKFPITADAYDTFLSSCIGGENPHFIDDSKRIKFVECCHAFFTLISLEGKESLTVRLLQDFYLLFQVSENREAFLNLSGWQNLLFQLVDNVGQNAGSSPSDLFFFFFSLLSKPLILVLGAITPLWALTLKILQIFVIHNLKKKNGWRLLRHIIAMIQIEGRKASAKIRQLFRRLLYKLNSDVEEKKKKKIISLRTINKGNSDQAIAMRTNIYHILVLLEEVLFYDDGIDRTSNATVPLSPDSPAYFVERHTHCDADGYWKGNNISSSLFSPHS